MVFDERPTWSTSCCGSRAFFRDESAGSACPAGSARCGRRRRCTDWWPDGRSARAADELALLDEIAQVMRDASICGLGQTAASAVQSAIATLGLFDAEEASA